MGVVVVDQEVQQLSVLSSLWKLPLLHLLFQFVEVEEEVLLIHLTFQFVEAEEALLKNEN